MCLRPATPGFLITVAATVCLVIVCFSVPWFKTVYFLKAGLAVENISGDVTFGTLGYCLELPGNTTCTSPKIGYQFDPTQLNELLGLDGDIQIPSLFVSWLTYPLVLHIVGLILAAISALFGLLAHVREMSMTCFSTCFSGFAATIVLIAFIFDLVIFFVARSRMNSVSGGSATIGTAVWLTLAAWLLLFFAGCAFGFGRCCMSRRPAPSSKYTREPDQSYSEAMRLDAMKAESDRKTRQQTEVGLPAFPALQDVESQPLSAAMQEPEYLYVKEDEDEDPQQPYRDRTPSPGRQQSTADIVAAPPVQALNAPYQPVFRPSHSTSLQPSAAANDQSMENIGRFAAMPDLQSGTSYGAGYHPSEATGYYPQSQYAYPSPDQRSPAYDRHMQGMPESTPIEHWPYNSQGTGAPAWHHDHVATGVANAGDYRASRRTEEPYTFINAPNSYNHAGGQVQPGSSPYQEEEAATLAPTYQPPVSQYADNYQSPYLPQPGSRSLRHPQR